MFSIIDRLVFPKMFHRRKKSRTVKSSNDKEKDSLISFIGRDKKANAPSNMTPTPLKTKTLSPNAMFSTMQVSTETHDSMACEEGMKESDCKNEHMLVNRPTSLSIWSNVTEDLDDPDEKPIREAHCEQQCNYIETWTCDEKTSNNELYYNDSYYCADKKIEVFVDPITLEPLGPHDCTFVYRPTCGNRQVIYNISSIVRYIVTTGDFTDPVTRFKLSDADLRMIDEISLNCDEKLPLITSVYSHRDYYEKLRNKRLTVATLETLTGEIIVDILQMVERVFSAISARGAEHKLILLFSELEVPFLELKSVCIESAFLAHKNWKCFLLGPKKKPTRNIEGTLDLALRLLEDLWTSSDQEKLVLARENTGLSSITWVGHC